MTRQELIARLASRIPRSEWDRVGTLPMTGEEAARLFGWRGIAQFEEVVLRCPPTILPLLIDWSDSVGQDQGQDEADIMDSKAAAAYLGYSVSGLRKLIRSGAIQPIQFDTPRLPGR